MVGVLADGGEVLAEEPVGQLVAERGGVAFQDGERFLDLPASALVGAVLERGVIRFLYGRPLETLLATWGISLVLIQLVRVLFGAQNVEVANPAWLSGGVQLLPNLVLPWNRIAVIAFVLLVLAMTWLLLNKTRLGMNVRAVTQNRAMAACCGVPTGRVDMLAFGLGSGIAGLGGVALSQLGNVGPELGQGYIIDSFLVVVLGGVGQLAGSVAAQKPCSQTRIITQTSEQVDEVAGTLRLHVGVHLLGEVF